MNCGTSAKSALSDCGRPGKLSKVFVGFLGLLARDGGWGVGWGVGSGGWGRNPHGLDDF